MQAEDFYLRFKELFREGSEALQVAQKKMEKSKRVYERIYK